MNVVILAGNLEEYSGMWTTLISCVLFFFPLLTLNYSESLLEVVTFHLTPTVFFFSSSTCLPFLLWCYVLKPQVGNPGSWDD